MMVGMAEKGLAAEAKHDRACNCAQRVCTQSGKHAPYVTYAIERTPSARAPPTTYAERPSDRKPGRTPTHVRGPMPGARVQDQTGATGGSEEKGSAP